ncbi:MAG: hypothetical protein QOJ31_1654, partial [Gaiellales bacterium]|jgi:hypothetical protein|nr:hypothetical protein [Gaiellales bacterium]MDX6546138.1 hypothetical protein [Gaiellales bacterium]MDX6550970.1 hypothetical protein [Gaiellales bacterium]
MYPSRPSELLRSALSLLPPMPCSIDVISDDGGCFPLTLAAVEGDLVYAYGDRELVRKHLLLEARLRDDRGEGWDIRFTILRSYFQSGDELLLHLDVTEVIARDAERRTPRAHLAELATARVLFGKTHERDELFDVRLADVSAAGAAFISERTLSTGDLLELTTVVDDRPIRFELRVVRSIPAVYGRNRVGCEITNILEADRHTLLKLAERYQREGSPEQRDPHIARTLELARNRTTLARRPVKRYA